jgi:hypothetical protein
MAGISSAFVAGLTVFALLTAPLPAFADFVLNIVGAGGYNQTIHDNLAGDLNPLAGAIAVIAGVSIPTIPGFSTGTITVDSNSPGNPGSSTLGPLGWSLLATAAAGLHTATITTSSQGFTSPASGTASVLTSTFAGTLTGGGTGSRSAIAQQWVDLGDVLFGMGALTPGPQGPFTTTAFADSASTGFVAVTPYSITDRVTLSTARNITAGGTLTSAVAAVPEPITMFLGGTGLLMLGYAARRRLFGR